MAIHRHTTRTAPKLMFSILACESVMSDANVDGIEVEAELLHHYPVMFCCCATGDCRESD